ncbi:MAG: hypothetical protein M1820_001671 [Bogoriella megaspora]|nr:MAG: hypothetical protein M1820_001671 [Bogoriella megaspora]
MITVKCQSSWTDTRSASLSRNETGMLNPYGAYGVGNDNETDRSIMWEKLEVSLGSVAIDLEWAKQKGLPEAQKFPWDHSKGIYLLNGHHSLHCLRKIRRWVTIAHHNGTQLDTYSHVVHCADLLLQNILCDADDTPIYTTASVKKDAGLNQQRQCRSWEALNAWAETQTACYAFINETQSVNSTLERYKYCPQGSPYADTMRSILGYPSKWRQDRPANFESIPHYWENFTRNSLDFHEDTDI